MMRAFKGIWKFHGLAEVDGKEVASAEIMVAPETKVPAKPQSVIPPAPIPVEGEAG